MRKLIWTILIVLVVAIILTATVPARVVWRYQSARLPAVKLSQIEGTIWRGSAEVLQVQNIPIGKLRWRLQPLSLLRLQPTVSAELDGPVQARAEISRSLGKLRINQFRATSDAIWLKPVLAIPAVEPTGKLSIDFDDVVLDEAGVPETARGEILLSEAGVTGIANATLNDVKIEISPQTEGANTGLKGVIRSVGNRSAMISVKGEFTLVQRHYTASVRVEPNQDNIGVQQVLKWIGAPADNGARLLLIQGQIVLPNQTVTTSAPRT
jgi:hypothetical protein